MSEPIQLTIVIAAIIFSAAYAIWRIRKSLKNKSGACSGCLLKETCEKNKKKNNH